MRLFIERYAGRAVAASCVAFGAWLAKSGIALPEEAIAGLSAFGIAVAVVSYDIIERKARNLFKKDKPDG